MDKQSRSLVQHGPRSVPMTSYKANYVNQGQHPGSAGYSGLNQLRSTGTFSKAHEVEG